MYTVYNTTALNHKYPIINISTASIKIHKSVLRGFHLSVIVSLLCFNFPTDRSGGGSVVSREGFDFVFGSQLFPTRLSYQSQRHHAFPSWHWSGPCQVSLMALTWPLMCCQIFLPTPAAQFGGDVAGASPHRPSSSAQFTAFLWACVCESTWPDLHTFSSLLLYYNRLSGWIIITQCSYIK